MLTIFTKRSRVLIMRAFWIYQSSEYASGSEDARVLIKKGFWIYQGCEYASGSQDARVLNIPRFWICHWFWINKGSEYVKVTQGSEYAWICLPAYACIWLNMPRYVWICPNLPEWLLLYISHCDQHTYFNVYTKLEVLVLRTMFSWRYKIWFFL